MTAVKGPFPLFLLNLSLPLFYLSSSSLLPNRVVKYSTTKRSTTLSTTRSPLHKHVPSDAPSTSCVIKHQRRRQSRRHRRRRRRRRSTTAAIDSHAKSHRPFKVHSKCDAYPRMACKGKARFTVEEERRNAERYLLILLDPIIKTVQRFQIYKVRVRESGL